MAPWCCVPRASAQPRALRVLKEALEQVLFHRSYGLFVHAHPCGGMRGTSAALRNARCAGMGMRAFPTCGHRVSTCCTGCPPVALLQQHPAPAEHMQGTGMPHRRQWQCHPQGRLRRVRCRACVVAGTPCLCAHMNAAACPCLPGCAGGRGCCIAPPGARARWPACSARPAGRHAPQVATQRDGVCASAPALVDCGAKTAPHTGAPTRAAPHTRKCRPCPTHLPPPLAAAAAPAGCWWRVRAAAGAWPPIACTPAAALPVG